MAERRGRAGEGEERGGAGVEPRDRGKEGGASCFVARSRRSPDML